METTTNVDNLQPIEQKESIKLTINAKGNYQWEIKLLADGKIENELTRLEQINNRMVMKYGTNEEVK